MSNLAAGNLRSVLMVFEFIFCFSRFIIHSFGSCSMNRFHVDGPYFVIIWYKKNKTIYFIRYLHANVYCYRINAMRLTFECCQRPMNSVRAFAAQNRTTSFDLIIYQMNEFGRKLNSRDGRQGEQHVECFLGGRLSRLSIKSRWGFLGDFNCLETWNILT